MEVHAFDFPWFLPVSLIITPCYIFSTSFTLRPLVYNLCSTTSLQPLLYNLRTLHLPCYTFSTLLSLFYNLCSTISALDTKQVWPLNSPRASSTTIATCRQLQLHPCSGTPNHYRVTFSSTPSYRVSPAPFPAAPSLAS